MRALICGGCVIGASTAYPPGCRGAAATVVEQWPFARRSFALHELAHELGGDWGYRRLDTHSGFARIPARRSGNLQEINWLSAGVTVDRRLGSTQTAARSSPVLLSRQ
jgi:hypothetical protein